MTSQAFSSKALPKLADTLAPDGAEVRLLAGLAGGSMAHFLLKPGQVSKAVTHRTVEEIWFVLSGEGEMWRKQESQEEVTSLVPGLSLSIPVGTHFQFRNTGADAFAAVAITMPPWPGEGEALFIPGYWPA